jgi:hypothetical protein
MSKMMFMSGIEMTKAMLAERRKTAEKIAAERKKMADKVSCDLPGDPSLFYFVFPSDSESRGHLDINEAIRLDGGKTPLCQLYLNHILGPERSAIMMANKIIRDRHLTVILMPNFQNTGFDTVVMRYTETPAVSGFADIMSKYAHINNMPEFFVLSGIGVGLMGAGIYDLVKGRKEQDKGITSGVLLLGLGALGIPIAVFISALRVARTERARMLELETRHIGAQFQQWQEVALSAAVEPPAEPTEPPTSVAGRKTRRAQRVEFNRVQAQSPEAAVAGGADPRSARTKKAHSPKREQSTSRSKWARKLVREGKMEPRPRGAARSRAKMP